MTEGTGNYVVGNIIQEPEPVVILKKQRRAIRTFNELELAVVVDKLPLFPGGNEGFQVFIDEISREMRKYLDKEQKKTYVMIEFIIDKNGNPAYSKVIKGGNEEMNDLLQERFEGMPAWKPATRLDKAVAIKLKQSLEIERK